jgi:hypothetical protein
MLVIAPAMAEASCTLVFTAQPANNVVPDITSAPFDPHGAPVRVECRNAAGIPLSSFRSLVTLVVRTATDGPTDATLSGNSVRAIGGVAEFPHLSVDRAGDFTLRATSLAVPESGWPLSSAFRMWNDGCGQDEQCKASFLLEQRRLFDVAFTNTIGGLVTLGTGLDQGPDCSTPTFTDPFFHAPAAWTTLQQYPAPATMGPVIVPPGALLAEVRIDKYWRKIVEARGNSSYRVCAAVEAAGLEEPPTAWNGTPEGTPATLTPQGDEYVFLFPDCTDLITKFCMVSVKSNKAGDIVETVITGAGAGDPKHW